MAKIGQNGQNLPKMAKNWPKRPEVCQMTNFGLNGQNLVEMTKIGQNGQILAKMNKIGPKWPKLG